MRFNENEKTSALSRRRFLQATALTGAASLTPLTSTGKAQATYPKATGHAPELKLPNPIVPNAPGDYNPVPLRTSPAPSAPWAAPACKSPS